MSVTITPGASPEVVLRLLRGLPEWFGIESATQEYAAAARKMPGFVAVDGTGDPVGVALHVRHFAETAEIHLMAVERGWHRCGVGRALVEEIERTVWGDGARLLLVKTLGPSHPDPGYVSTRAFYRACGFLPLTELDDLWPGNPCLFMVKPLGGR